MSKARAQEAALEWTERLGIQARRGDEVQKLSLGNQQRVQLAAALVADPALLILDEPFSGLDPVAVDVMSQVLRERAEAGIPTLFSSHQLDVVERLCDRIVIIRSGQLVAAGSELTTSSGRPVEIVDLTGQDPATTLGEDSADQAGHVDMVLDLAADQPELMVQEKADQGVVAALSALIQQRALADQVAALGGDPAAVSQAVAEAAPSVTVLDPPSSDRADAGVRYTTLMIVNILLFIVIMGGGQVIAMGVVEEKSSRIVEILLACVRPTSLLAGKVIGTGLAVISSYALIAVVAAATAAVMDVLPNTDLRLDSVVAVMLVWMVVGFATFAILFGAAGALVSRQEDMGNVTMPIMMLAMVPYMLSFVMAMGSPQSVVWRVLAYIPPFSAFLMPARLTFGYSDWGEQAIALAIALAVLPLLGRLAARVYTRAVTRMGARVPLKEVLGRRAA